MFFLTEHKEAHCSLEKFIRQQQFSFSLLYFWRHFYGVPITFERYHFQSKYDLVLVRYALVIMFVPISDCLGSCYLKKMVKFSENRRPKSEKLENPKLSHYFVHRHSLK